MKVVGRLLTRKEAYKVRNPFGKSRGTKNWSLKKIAKTIKAGSKALRNDPKSLETITSVTSRK